MEGLRLAPQQAQYWRTNRADAIACAAYVFSGHSTPAALRAAFEAVLCRHEIFAVTFATLPGVAVPLQVLGEEIDFGCEEVTSAVATPTPALLQARAAEGHRFDLATGPLVHAALLSFGDGSRVLLVQTPATIIDAASFANLGNELMLAYNGALEEGEDDEDDGPVQYFDFSEWLFELHEDEDAQAGLNVWEQAAAAMHEPHFPVLHGTDSGRHQTRITLENPALASAEHLDATLLTWYALICGRYGSRDQATVSVYFHGRNLDLSDGIGLFARYAPVNIRLDRATDLAANTLATTRLMDKASVALEYFLPEKAPAAASRLAFEYRPAPAPHPAGALTMTTQVLRHDPPAFTLHLLVEPTATGLNLTFTYDAAVLSARTVADMAAGFQAFEQGFPTVPLRALELPAPQEAQRLREAGRGPVYDYARGRTVHSLIEAAARRFPNTPAVIHGDGVLTYAELEQRAEQLAAYLVTRGIGLDDVVGIFTERSPESVIAVYGVLKAGAAYLPLDPEYPDERLQFMVQDTGVTLILTAESCAGTLTADKATMVYLDRDQAAIAAAPARRSPSPALPESLAYIIYTSGSTGRPKGVMVHHQGVANYLGWASDFYRVSSGSGSALHSSLGFDLTVTSLFLPLIDGKTVHMVPMEHGVEGLTAGLEEGHDFSLVKLTPSHLDIINQSLPAAKAARGTRALVIGGEALYGENLKFWRTHAPATRLINEYGPTETVVGCTVFVDNGESDGPVPIGHAVANTNIYLLDADLNLVPTGAVGEIYVGGDGVTRGYFNRPALTAARYLPDPFAAEPGRRLYKTGDLAAYQPDGSLIYLGRNDGQVKIRGFRIELGEVEAVLKAQPDVHEVAVIPRDLAGEKRLVGYYTQAGAKKPQVDELRAFMSEKLPEHMLPSIFIPLPTMPLTAHGKIDRAALPEPSHDRPDLTDRYVAPQNPLQEKLVAIWQEALGIDQIGIHDDFFRLGGDSIRSVRVSALAGKHGITFSVQELFEHTTVAALAGFVAARGNDSPPPSEAVTTEAFEMIDAADRAKLPADVVDAYPLGATQLGMLFHMETPSDSNSAPAYHNVNVFHLGFKFVEAPFKQAVAHVVARHPILRTSFDLTSYSEPLQLVHQHAVLPVTVFDVRHQDRVTQERDFEAFLKRMNYTPLDVRKAPMVHIYFHIVADDSVKFTLIEPHSISDGWSTHLTMVEIFEVYQGLLTGKGLPQARPLPVQFRDFIKLERRAIADEQTRAFWREQLRDSDLARLPTFPDVDKAAADMHDHKLMFNLPADLVRRLRALGQQLGVPLKTVFLTVHMKVLGMITGTTTPTTGLVFNGRPEVEGGDDVRGLFLNTLPFRLKLGNESWRSTIERVYKAEVAMIPHRRYPLSHIMQRQGTQQVFEAAFTFLHFHSVQEVFASGSIDEAGEGGDLSRADFPFSAVFMQNPTQEDRIALYLEYDVTQFPKSWIESVYAIYQQAMTAACQRPDSATSSVSLLPEAMFTKLVHRHNQTESIMASPGLLHQRFAALAATAPTRPALEFENEQISYGDLERASDQLANLLAARGAGPEKLVGISLKRGPRMAVALLAVIKAGAAWLPLDPDYPRERLAYMLADSGAWGVIKEAATAAGLPTHEGFVLCFDGDAESIAAAPTHTPNIQVCPQQTAYMIYTSGSTGRPKGVRVPHGGIDNLVAAQIKRFAPGDGSRVLQFSSFNFDASVFDFVMALCSGACLCMADSDALLPGQGLADLLRAKRITHVTLPPSSLAPTPAADLPDLTHVCVAGEACPEELALRWSQGRHFHNLYGPTEATIWSTALAYQNGTPTIGRAVDNVQIYILDAHQQPTPEGVTGEIYIGGAGVTRGYHQRAALTAERFVPAPFGPAGARLYRSGDLGRFLPNGEIAFMGRADEQIKIRGFRIEPGEIVRVLTRHEAVAEAVVLPFRDQTTHMRLAAYVVPVEAGATPTAKTLREHLGRDLPDYMIPATFIALDRLPLTPNGKLDSRALPQPDTAQTVGTAYVAPRDERETALCDILATILGHDQIGINDNFFELGGDSILGVQVAARANQMGLKFSPRELFKHQTVAELMPYVTTGTAIVAEQGTVTGSAPLTPIQAWFRTLPLPNPNHWNMGFLLATTKRLEHDALARVVHALLDHHDALRAVLDGDRLSYNAGPIPSAYQRFDLSGRDSRETTRRIEAEAAAIQAGFDLGRAPLFKVAYFACDDGAGDRILLTAHHLIIDAVSWQIVMQDLQTAYAATQRGDRIELPVKTTAFRDWAQRLSDYARGATAAPEIAYWTAPERSQAFDLPADGDSDSGSGTVTVTTSLDRRQTLRLLDEVPEQARTSAELLLLTALGQTLKNHTGGNRFLINMESHGREALFEDMDVSRTVGWFTTLYPVLLDLLGSADAGQALKLVKQQTASIPHAGLGYGALRYLGDDATRNALAAMPEARIGFNYLGRIDRGRVNEGFSEAEESAGPLAAPGSPRPHDLDLACSAVDDVLRIDWNYRPDRLTATTVNAMVADFGRVLNDLIETTLSGEEPGYTPSDFDAANLDAGELDDLLDEFA